MAAFLVVAPYFFNQPVLMYLNENLISDNNSGLVAK